MTVMAASDKESKEVVNEFLLDPNILTQAACRGDLEKVKELLSKGYHPDARNKYGRTALQVMDYAYPKIAQILLENGADPNVRDSDVGRTPLHDAVADGTPSTVMCLLQNGADPLAKETLFGNTPAHIAAEKGNEQMICLLESCSSFKEQNNQQQSPRDLAVANDYPLVTKRIAWFCRTRGFRLEHQCRLSIRRAVGGNRLRRLNELEPLVPPKFTRYLMLLDEDANGRR